MTMNENHFQFFQKQKGCICVTEYKYQVKFISQQICVLILERIKNIEQASVVCTDIMYLSIQQLKQADI